APYQYTPEVVYGPGSAVHRPSPAPPICSQAPAGGRSSQLRPLYEDSDERSLGQDPDDGARIRAGTARGAATLDGRALLDHQPWVEPDALPSARGAADPTCRRDERAVPAELGDNEELVGWSDEQVGFGAGVWRIGVARADHGGPLHESTRERPL